MDDVFRVPAFKSEADEAKWWFENQDRLAQEFDRAALEGRLGLGSVARRANLTVTTLQLDPADISKARSFAERRGIEYQVYLTKLMHEALQREEQVVS